MNSSFMRVRKRTPFTRPATSGFTKAHSNPLGIWAKAKNAYGRYLAGTKANPSTIGLSRRGPWPAATIPKSLFSASQTIARKIKPIQIITPAAPSQKPKRNSNRGVKPPARQRPPDQRPSGRDEEQDIDCDFRTIATESGTG